MTWRMPDLDLGTQFLAFWRERERDWELRGEQSLFLVDFVISNSLEVDVSGVRCACSNDHLPKKHSITHAIQNSSSFLEKKYLKL